MLYLSPSSSSVLLPKLILGLLVILPVHYLLPPKILPVIPGLLVICLSPNGIVYTRIVC